MKPKPGKPRPGARTPSAPPAKRGSALSPRVLVTAIYLVFGALVVWFALYDFKRQHASEAGSMTPEAAGAHGEALMKQERRLEAVPFFRRALEGSAGGRWQAHLQFASFLGTLSTRVAPIAGINQPLARSSVERVAIARECEREYMRAWDLAPAGEARATVASLYAEHLFAWGRVYEAFVQFRTAESEAPGDEKRRERADLFQHMLEHPEDFKTTQELMLEPPAAQ